MSPQDSLPVIGRARLALCNGQDRPEIWVAFEGKVYDLTASRLWKNGRHYEHWAGQDLTQELKDSPHGRRVFEEREAIALLLKES
jgi:predicted heme/steroid binding protein